MSDIDGTTPPDDDDGGHDNSKKNPKKRPDYEVGYGKPPKAHQFAKGESGNPRGPKKGSRGLKKDLHKALSARHSIRVDGKIMKGTTQEMALLTLAKRAATGDVRATRELVDLTLKIFGPEDRGRERGALSPQDRELLDRMLGRIEPDDEASGDDNATEGDASDAEGEDPDANDGGADSPDSGENPDET